MVETVFCISIQRTFFAESGCKYMARDLSYQMFLEKLTSFFLWLKQ